MVKLGKYKVEYDFWSLLQVEQELGASPSEAIKLIGGEGGGLPLKTMAVFAEHGISTSDGEARGVFKDHTILEIASAIAQAVMVAYVGKEAVETDFEEAAEVGQKKA